MRRAVLFPFLWLIAAATAPGAAAQPLVADLSSRLIEITTGFVGTDVLLFGATEGPGEVVVVVRGPLEEKVVRRKERVAGIWVHGAAVRFADVPAYYRVAASRPLEEIAPEDKLVRLGLGIERLVIEPDGEVPEEIAEEFRAALIASLARQGLYGRRADRVRFIGARLFRVTITFPAMVRTGSYAVEVMLFENGELVSSELTPLTVRKVGMEAEIFRFAHEQAPLYGLIAILLALVAGWTAGVVFRKH